MSRVINGKSILPLIAFPEILALAYLKNPAVPDGLPAPGYQQFLANPTQYTFTCGCEVGGVSSAELSGEVMTIYYYYPCQGSVRRGMMEGTFNPETNAFQGVYNTYDKAFYGEIQFTFNQKGEARGKWDKGAGDVNMELRN